MSKEKRRVPKLRFPGFTEDWEQRKLSDILKVNSGKDYKHLDQGNIPVYGTGGYMVSVNESLSNIDAIGIGRKGTIDKPQYLKAPFWTVDTLFYLTALDKHSIVFLYYLMQLIPWKKFDESTGVPSLSKTTIDSISGFVPSNFQEEELISALFNQLDKIITLHQRKLEHLNLKKKAFLQKLFPKNGERYPELRFPGFTDAWEQRKLGDLMEVTSVKRIHQADWTDSGVRFFRARDIVSSMNNEEIDNPVFISKDKYEEYSRISGKVIEGDLLVTGVGTIGVPYLIKDTTPLYFKDGNIIWFKNNNTLNGSYFYYCFQNSYIQNQIYSASGKGTVGTYTIENGKKTSIRYPSLKEQIKIGNLLDTMTTMITLHQRKLEHLQLQKKALLQQMFV
ncbi:MAG: restriction endonuclease subunit S [Veillonella sp.]|uniref:restriction endonuclease subunit S n=1 Tax=Veillonella sp. TaxID=1926307 RepID=UPI00291B86B3|nr:restriction endonuclease subunit S [Veillonella sp.]MDU8950083.1 restriction endonuclease subunit S [Veillonella sp.]